MHQLRPYQQPISDATVAALTHGGRAQIVMACGTGKTLTGMRTVEATLAAAGLDAPVVVLAFPNLALLGQTVREWRAQSAWRTPLGVPRYADLAVCSDETISPTQLAATRRKALKAGAVEPDPVTASVADALAGQALPATTDPAKVAAFLRANTSAPRVLFTTYQSMDVVASAATLMRALDPTWQIDLVLADEAHRTAGNDLAAAFGTVLFDVNVPATRRLFMTATQRVVERRRGRKVSSVRSMDDETLYGPVTGQYTFKEAIEAGHLSDYQVHVVLVRQADVETVAGAPLDELDALRSGTTAHTITAAIATAKMARKHRLHRVMAFHNRVAHSTAFVAAMGTAHDLLTRARHKVNTDLLTFHVDGATPPADRDHAIATLRDLDESAGQWAVVSNVSVFTEGIDVPTLDCVVFADPRDSEVDVAQIVGRALRKSARNRPAAILVPVLVREGQDPDAVLASSEFSGAVQVIKAMRTVDARIVERFTAAHLEDLSTEDPTSGPTDGEATDEGLAAGDDEYDKASAWCTDPDGGSYHDVGGDGSPVRVTSGPIDGATAPVEAPRGPLPMLVIETPDALDDLDGASAAEPATPAPRATGRLAGLASLARAVGTAVVDLVLEPWELLADRAAAFRAAHGRHPNRASADEQERRLAAWLNDQRQAERARRLSASRRAHLDRTYPDWSESREAGWLDAADRLAAFMRAHDRTPSSHSSNPEERALGQWLNVQRGAIRGTRGRAPMPAERQRYLNENCPGWSSGRPSWDDRLAELANFRASSGRLPSISSPSEIERSVAEWLRKQVASARKRNLSAERRERLDAAFPGWNAAIKRIGAWGERVEELRQFRAATGKYPSTASSSPAERSLGFWLTTQRSRARSGDPRLTADQRALLDASFPDWAPDLRRG
ncbi:DEAD/DEAH box helicase [Cellulosimicrobium sp. Marseille-Q4280]|uniref:DEAD/DEAH box helicase n=1 Tax=Cellulosimicrobium sp. Marseille-Q4280 TaxID=2937992 RepID=UPI00203B2DFB|nr:DEAD/DEAH box helicase [Cellulosimicrobium sp. Marseille-Q4280]